MDAKYNRIIVALDVDSVDKAQALAEKLGPYVGGFKVGLELISSMLALIIGGNHDDAYINFKKIRHLFLTISGSKVFWDGKFDDIPNTIAGAARAVAGLSFKMFNVHASSSIDSMMEAVANKGQSLVL